MAVFGGTAAIFATAVSIGMLHGVEPGHGWPVAAVVAVYALADRFFDLHALQWMNYVAGGLLLLMAVHQWRGAGRHHHHHGHHHGEDHERDGDHDHGRAHDHSGGHGGDHRDDRHSGRDHGHSHGGAPAEPRAAGSLLGLVGFAFALGFVHEEEFAIIALAAGKANPWLVMGVYAAAVGLSLVLLTMVAIATLNRFDKQLARHQEHLPRISAVILALMGVAYLTGLL
jgi:cytochrome c biogenesis protein CcdA